MTRILVTGGAGFVGSAVALGLRQAYPGVTVVALDNLRRRGSELNRDRLKDAGVQFIHGDVRLHSDLSEAGQFDILIAASAEPSVSAGNRDKSRYTVDTNLAGTVNSLEAARREGASVLFISSSRVYPVEALRNLGIVEEQKRFSLSDFQSTRGASVSGISEGFGLSGHRSIYGATKLASEIMALEYSSAFDLPTVILRPGIISGAWQMGKVDQGVVSLWVARHLWGESLTYKGFGGSGKQVRDVLDVRDFVDLVGQLVFKLDDFTGETFNVGGGANGSVSLVELTQICTEITGQKLKMLSSKEESDVDVPIYVSDTRKIERELGWSPRLGLTETVETITDWLVSHEDVLRPTFLGED